MSIDVLIRDAASKIFARVTSDKALLVNTLAPSANELSPEILTRNKSFQAFVTTAAGSREMNVNGSVTPVDFFVTGMPDRTIVINRFRFIINSTNMNTATAGDLRRFGAIAAPGLTNGVLFQSVQQPVSTNLFADPVRDIGDFFNYIQTHVNFPNGVAAGVDFLSLDFILAGPIVFPAGFNNFVRIRIQDNLTTIAQFRCLVSGTQELL